jgi:hypothetical protein
VSLQMRDKMTIINGWPWMPPCFSWFQPSTERPQVRGPFFMTFGTCDSPPSALRQARLGRSLPEDASDAVPIAYVRFHSASTRLATLQTAHVPIRLLLYCMPRSLLLHAYCSFSKRPDTRSGTTHAHLTMIRAPINRTRADKEHSAV